VAKFAVGGKPAGKKDLGLIAMTYGNVYVASVAMGARDEHTLKAFLEAEAYDGPSLIIAYSHCIAHGINMTTGMQNQKAAVDAGQWLLYRYHPERGAAGENPLQLDSRAPKEKFENYAYNETRYRMLAQAKPSEARRLLREAVEDIDRGWRFLEHLAAFQPAPAATNGHAPPAAQDDSQKSAKVQAGEPPRETVGVGTGAQEDTQ
jgi:pyruvate-ferredoxin/flavodoxin oxidoreductase